jgi:hypothetical protein
MHLHISLVILVFDSCNPRKLLYILCNIDYDVNYHHHGKSEPINTTCMSINKSQKFCKGVNLVKCCIGGESIDQIVEDSEGL